jgi:hypothetical protein
MWSFGVPNVPCGVERNLQKLQVSDTQLMFLMYRVELKVSRLEVMTHSFSLFLMYRVELKEHLLRRLVAIYGNVPNVPCGVESEELVKKLYTEL